MDEVAIIGIGCRLPGDVDGPGALWDFLLEGRDGIREVPPDRWRLDRFYDPSPGAPGRTYTRRAGFLTGSPWDFDAGFFGMSRAQGARLDPRQRLLLEVTQQALDDAGTAPRVAGRPVGVYLGAGGWAPLADQVSRTFDLRGPSLTVDTACSSSLVALHQAVSALTRGEVEAAVVGGVSLLLGPEAFIELSRGRVLSPDGRCKSFDAAADGYGRGEGAGVVILKPLSQARADRDRVYAVIRGTGCNQDGGTATPAGPDVRAQAALLGQVTGAAGLAPAEVGYVEAHSTGSTVGDLVELAAVGSVLGAVPGRVEPLRVGSIKPAIGHLEAAAGVVGLIKAALVLWHRQIPAQTGLHRLNPAVPFDRYQVAVATTTEPFPGAHPVPVAVVNGFGGGGTNACAVLAAPPAPATPPAPPAPAVGVFPISGHTEQAARDLARRMADTLPDWADLSALEHLAWSRRTHLRHRFAVPYRGREDLRRRLREVARGQGEGGDVRTDRTPVFVCADADPAWVTAVLGGLGDEVYAGAARQVDAAFEAESGRSLLAGLSAAGPELRSRELAGPGTFLAQVAQASRLAALGVTPAAVLGHGSGEVAAAWLAGALSLPDAVTVIHHRSRLLPLDGPGPGPRPGPVLQALREHLAGLEPARQELPLFSTLTGAATEGTCLTADHWVRHLREPGQLAATLTTLVDEGHRVFLDLGPDAALPTHLAATLTACGQPGAVITAGGDPARPGPAGSDLARLYVAGALATGQPPGVPAPVPMCAGTLPAHGFERVRLRVADPERDAVLFGDPDAPALPGDRTQQDPAQWQVELSAERLAWLDEHLVGGRPLFPPAGYLDAALAAAAELTEMPRPCLAGVRMEHPLPIPAGQIPVLRLDVEASTGHFLIQSRPVGGGSWTTHATGRICEGPQPPSLRMPEPARPVLVLDGAQCYDRLTGRVGLGPAFRRIVSAEIGTQTVRAVVDATTVDPYAPHPHQAHPVVLAAALQCAALLTPDPGRPLVPSAIGAVRQFGPLTGQLRVGVTRTAVRDQTHLLDIVLATFSGRTLLELHDVELAPQHDDHPPPEPEDLWYETSFEPVPGREEVPTRPGRALVVALGAGAIPVAQSLAARRDGMLVPLTGTDPQAAQEVIAPVLRRCLREGPGLTLVVVGAGEPTQWQQDRLREAAHLVAGALGTARAVQAELDAALVDPQRPRPQLRGVLVTRHALAVPGDAEPVDPAGAGLVGVRRVLRDTQPDLLWRLVDIDDRTGPATVAAQCRTHGAHDEDPCDELVLRAGRTLGTVLRHTLPGLLDAHEAPAPLTDPEADFLVEAPATRRLADLALRQVPRRTPDPDQVELRIEGFAVNTKDTLKAVGAFAERELAGTASGTGLGMEGMGVVTAVGEQVEGVRIGDRRWVSVPGLARRYVTARVEDGVLEPIGHHRSLTFLGSGLALMTAHHCLHEVARVRPGDWVLVLGGTSSLALACTQVAARAGALVVATATDRGQGDQLRRAGAAAVLESPLAGLLPQVRRLTRGRGADVVISTCPGDAVLIGLEAAAEFGRVIEADGSEPGTGRALPMSVFEKNLSFTSVDLDRMLRHRPEQVRALFRQVRDRLETGLYQQLPSAVVGLDRLPEAFARVHRGELAGRLVVSMGSLEPAVKPPRPRIRLDPQATYLVTGGLGRLGLVAARWLAGMGARRVLLADVDDIATPRQRGTVDALAARGVEVRVERADLSDADAVHRLLDRPGDPPLRGIVHAVTDPLPRTSVTGRAEAAWMLHTAAERLGLELDHVVLFSSVCALAGAETKAGDAAAHAMVDALARYRRAQGLPALAVRWEVPAGAGTSRADADYLFLLGLRELDPDQAMPSLDLALALGRTQGALSRVDWATWAQTHPASATTLRYRGLLAGPEARAGSGPVPPAPARGPKPQTGPERPPGIRLPRPQP